MRCSLSNITAASFYDDVADRRKVQQNLLNMLFKSAQTTKRNTHVQGHAHDVVTSTKAVVCTVLTQLLHIRSNDILTDVLEMFKDECTNARSQSSMALESLNKGGNDKRTWGDFVWIHEFRAGEQTDENFVALMLELCEYNNDTLRIAAMDLLLQTYTTKGDLLQHLKETEMFIDDTEIKTQKKLKHTIVRLTHCEHEDIFDGLIQTRMIEHVEWLNSLVLTVHTTTGGERHSNHKDV